jgi:hypothetical protein
MILTPTDPSAALTVARQACTTMDPRLDTGGWLTLTGEPLDSSFPTGTFTLQDTLSLSQRESR